MCRSLWRDLGLTDVRLDINSLGQAEERRAHRAALIAHFEAHREHLDAEALRRLHSNPLRILDTKNPAMQPLVEAAPEAAVVPGRGVAEALRRPAAVLDAAGPALPHQPAPGARHGLLQPHGLRVGHRSSGRAGHDLRRRPLRRPDRAHRRQAGAGHRLGHGHRTRAGPAGTVRRGHRCRCPMPMPCCRTPRRCRRPCRCVEALRAAGVAVVCTQPARTAWGSMKSQFKKADASGARHALIFGAEELARGEVAVKPLRDACGGPAQPLLLARQCPMPAGWPCTCSTHNRGLNPPQPTMATQLDLQEQEQLDALKAFWKKYGNLITWTAHPGAGRLRRLERLAVVAARPGHARPAAMFDELEARRPGWDDRQAGRRSSPT
jgi:histidyl-tRNA synthetase